MLADLERGEVKPEGLDLPGKVLDLSPGDAIGAVPEATPGPPQVVEELPGIS